MTVKLRGVGRLKEYPPLHLPYQPALGTCCMLHLVRIATWCFAVVSLSTHALQAYLPLCPGPSLLVCACTT